MSANPHTALFFEAARAMEHLAGVVINDSRSSDVSKLAAAEKIDRAKILRGLSRGSIPQEVRVTSSNVVVAVAVYWNHNMALCPQGKVQLLSRDNLPAYGVYRQGDPFYKAWAGIPENPPGH